MPPRRRHTRLKVVLLVLLPVVLVLVGGVFAGPAVVGIARDRSVQLVTPAMAGGLNRGNDSEVLAGLAKISDDYDTNVRAYYEDGKHPVVIWGGTTTLLLLDLEIDSFFAGLERQGYVVADRKRLSAGSVGGELECARMTDADQDRNGVCIWMNHGALLAFLSPDRLPAETVGRQVTKMLPDLVATS